MTRAVVALAAIAVLLVTAGCGGGPGPDATVRSYYRALLAADGPRACSKLTDELERDVSGSRGARKAGGTCPDVLALAAGLNPDRAGDDLDDLAVTVDEHGDSATARLANPLTGKRETLDLARRDGDWKIASLVLRPQR